MDKNIDNPVAQLDNTITNADATVVLDAVVTVSTDGMFTSIIKKINDNKMYLYGFIGLLILAYLGYNYYKTKNMNKVVKNPIEYSVNNDDLPVVKKLNCKVIPKKVLNNKLPVNKIVNSESSNEDDMETKQNNTQAKQIVQDSENEENDDYEQVSDNQPTKQTRQLNDSHVIDEQTDEQLDSEIYNNAIKQKSLHTDEYNYNVKSDIDKIIADEPNVISQHNLSALDLDNINNKLKVIRQT